jgi:hypothetical protein
MRRILALAIVCCAVASTVACKEKKPPPAKAPEPAKVVAPAKPQGMPPVCIAYIVAIKKLEGCATAEKAELLAQFEADRDTLSGVKPTPREDLEAICDARAPAVQRIVDEKCGPPTDPRNIPALKAEVEKAKAGIDAAAKIASDATQPDAARVDAKAKVGDLQKQKADLETLIHQKQCLENPLEKGC